MSTIKISRTQLLLLTAAALAAGCAKRQEAVVSEPPKPAPVAAAPAPANPAPASNTELRDLQALIGRTVLHFDFDEAVLKPDDQGKLEKVADAMRTAAPKAKIRIEGNCDERGTEEYNMALGYRRAAVAKKYLSDLGVDGSRVETISYGFNKPVDPRHNEEAWAANRRDEFASLGGD